MKAFAYSIMVLLFAIWCAILTRASGQNATSVVVRGTVKDPTGAVMERASVNLRSSKKEYDRTVVTDEEGRYRFTDVPRAPFHLHVEAPDRSYNR